MKNILKYLFVFVSAVALFFSCNKETNFDALTNAPDANAAYYLQFINASQTLETGVTEAGGLVEITTTVGVVLMGMPQSQDITVAIATDPSSTISASMYSMSANSITIPAGKTSGSVTFTTHAAKMPVGQTLKFALKMDAGEHNSPNANGIKLLYNLKRIEFCPLVNGVADFVGSWSGDDGAGKDGTFPSVIKTSLNGTKLTVSGMSDGFMVNFWGESIIAGGTFTMTVKGNGLIDIPRQYIYTTVYKGANSDYEIKGSGKWVNCGAKPKMLITYDIYYVGDEKGLAAQYSSYLDGSTFLTANITLN